MGNKTLHKKFIALSFIISIILHLTLIYGFSQFRIFRLLDFVSHSFTVNLEEDAYPAYDLTKAPSPSALWKNSSHEQLQKEERLPPPKSGEADSGSFHNDESDEGVELAGPSPVQDTGPADQVHASVASAPLSEYLPPKEPLPRITPVKNEKFTYSISWIGIKVGTAFLEAVRVNNILRITSEVHSAPFLSTFYEVNDRAESWVVDEKPFNFRIKQHEGKYRSNKETIFDPERGTVTFFNYLQNFKDEHPMANGIAWDLISGFYYLRTQTLKVGESAYIDVFDSNKFYKAKIEVLREEKIIGPDNIAIDTIVIKPSLESEGLFQRKGDILIWLTNDPRKIPVRVSTEVVVGTVTAELQGLEIK